MATVLQVKDFSCWWVSNSKIGAGSAVGIGPGRRGVTGSSRKRTRMYSEQDPSLVKQHIDDCDDMNGLLHIQNISWVYIERIDLINYRDTPISLPTSCKHSLANALASSAVILLLRSPLAATLLPVSTGRSRVCFPGGVTGGESKWSDITHADGALRSMEAI